MNWRQIYEKWLVYDDLEAELKQSIISKNEIDLKDCFYTSLSFGTAGIRGEIGPGPNRMNTYTVRKATNGLASFIMNNGKHAMQQGVVIAFDSRHKSKEFAMEAAKVLVGNHIETYLFKSIKSTPELSFAVRSLKASHGIVITASHNPKEYNGLKVYNANGCQVSPLDAKKIMECIEGIEDELSISVITKEELVHSSYFKEIGEELDQEYLNKVASLATQTENVREVAKEYPVVYTPLNGTGSIPVRKILDKAGFKKVYVVAEQAEPDPNFPTVTQPNPENESAFSLAKRDGKKVGAELLLATDPDADRLGVAVKNKDGEYELLSGNQIGALLINYLIQQKKVRGTLPKNAVVLKSIVTSEFGQSIAAAHGIETINTLTGFKYIGEKITEFEQSEEQSFLFGYEESYGYLIGDFVRDKDAIQTALLITEIGCFYKSQGKNLLDILEQLYSRYGYYKENQKSITLVGENGKNKVLEIMKYFRQEPVLKLGNSNIKFLEDYQVGKRLILSESIEEQIELPKENVLKLLAEDQSWMAIRPSGTEPKIKFYFGVRGNSLTEVNSKLLKIYKQIDMKLGSLVNNGDNGGQQ